MNQPIERDGQLYNEDELRRYFELPDSEPDAILSVCDTKDRGTDFCAMPIVYQYGQDFYVDEIICDNGNPEVVEARLVDALLRHKVQLSRFESNSAGGRVAQKIQEGVKEKGGRKEILEIIDKNYPSVISGDYLAAIRKTTFFEFAVDTKASGSFSLE